MLKILTSIRVFCKWDHHSLREGKPDLFPNAIRRYMRNAEAETLGNYYSNKSDRSKDGHVMNGIKFKKKVMPRKILRPFALCLSRRRSDNKKKKRGKSLKSAMHESGEENRNDGYRAPPRSNATGKRSQDHIEDCAR